jgi:hypothetical protein
MSELYWRSDWRLVSRTYVYPSLFQNLCRMTIAQINVTPMIDYQLRARLMQLARQTMDVGIPRLTHIRPQAEKAWHELQQPIALADRAWLSMQPEAVWIAHLSGTGQAVSTAFILTARPRIVFGDRPEARGRPLPRLQVAYPQGAGLHLAIEAEMPFTEATLPLAKALESKRYAIGHRDVTVGDVEVSGSTQGVQVRIEVTGFVQGTFTVTGKPVYDAESAVLSLKDLDVAFEGEDVVDEATEGLFHKRLLATLTEQARWPLGARIEQAKKRLERALNQPVAPQVELRTQLTHIRPENVYTTATGVRVIAVVDGRAQLVLGGR